MFRFCLKQQHTDLNIDDSTYTDGILKYRMLPEDGLSKTERWWILQYIYIIFIVLMMLKSVTLYYSNIYCDQCTSSNRIYKCHFTFVCVCVCYCMSPGISGL